MPCERCATIPTVAIRLPAELAAASAYCRTAIADGRLLSVERPPDAYRSDNLVPWSEFDGVGPNNDHLSYFFACTGCGRLFELTCETYHGSGGSLHPHAPDAPPQRDEPGLWNAIKRQVEYFLLRL